MPRYLVSVWHETDYVVDFTTEDMQRIGPKVGALNEELMASGQWVFGAGLQPASTAVVFHGADAPMTDGPYAETKEVMGGFWIIKTPDDATAREWARKASIACEGPVELRLM